MFYVPADDKTDSKWREEAESILGAHIAPQEVYVLDHTGTSQQCIALVLVSGKDACTIYTVVHTHDLPDSGEDVVHTWVGHNHSTGTLPVNIFDDKAPLLAHLQQLVQLWEDSRL